MNVVRRLGAISAEFRRKVNFKETSCDGLREPAAFEIYWGLFIPRWPTCKRLLRAGTDVIFLLWIGATMLSGVPALAQVSVNEEQGLKPYDSLHGGDLDSVSMTNRGVVGH